jgi:hypothetical protein
LQGFRLVVEPAVDLFQYWLSPSAIITGSGACHRGYLRASQIGPCRSFSVQSSAWFTCFGPLKECQFSRARPPRLRRLSVFLKCGSINGLASAIIKGNDPLKSPLFDRLAL